MLEFAKRAALAGVAAALVFPAAAADIMEPPPVIEAPEPAPVYVAPAEASGWYIRGDLGYGFSDDVDAEYINYGNPGVFGGLSGELDDAFSAGVGVGVQVNKHFRVDLTADRWFKKDFKGSTSGVWNNAGTPTAYTTSDTASVSTWLLLANAYVDLGTWHGITPYVGAGIGGAHVKWDDLTNANNPGGPPGGPFVHEGKAGWRFAAAVMAGASYCLNRNLKLDAGYRFSHIKGGKMFGYEAGGNNGPGWDKGLNTHEVRAGLRYQFGGGSSDCGEQVAYEPPPPVIEPVYK